MSNRKEMLGQGSGERVQPPVLTKPESTPAELRMQEQKWRIKYGRTFIKSEIQRRELLGSLKQKNKKAFYRVEENWCNNLLAEVNEFLGARNNKNLLEDDKKGILADVRSDKYNGNHRKIEIQNEWEGLDLDDKEDSAWGKLRSILTKRAHIIRAKARDLDCNSRIGHWQLDLIKELWKVNDPELLRQELDLPPNEAELLRLTELPESSTVGKSEAPQSYSGRAEDWGQGGSQFATQNLPPNTVLSGSTPSYLEIPGGNNPSVATFQTQPGVAGWEPGVPQSGWPVSYGESGSADVSGSMVGDPRFRQETPEAYSFYVAPQTQPGRLAAGHRWPQPQLLHTNMGDHYQEQVPGVHQRPPYVRPISQSNTHEGETIDYSTLAPGVEGGAVILEHQGLQLNAIASGSRPAPGWYYQTHDTAQQRGYPPDVTSQYPQAPDDDWLSLLGNTQNDSGSHEVDNVEGPKDIYDQWQAFLNILP